MILYSYSIALIIVFVINMILYLISSSYLILLILPSIVIIMPIYLNTHHSYLIITIFIYKYLTSLYLDIKNIESFNFFIYIYFSSVIFIDSLTVKSLSFNYYFNCLVYINFSNSYNINT